MRTHKTETETGNVLTKETLISEVRQLLDGSALFYIHRESEKISEFLSFNYVEKVIVSREGDNYIISLTTITDDLSVITDKSQTFCGHIEAIGALRMLLWV